jgi:hypothetical protein
MDFRLAAGWQCALGIEDLVQAGICLGQRISASN